MPRPEIDRKNALRESTLAIRRAVPPGTWAAEDAARDRHVLRAVDGFPAGTAAVYVSLPGEPGTHAIIDGLLERGWRVLVPKLRRAPDWGWFRGWDELTPGWAGIPQPAEGLGAQALSEASLILLSGLAIGRDGSRLGTGGGWYDRALAERRPDALLVALVRAAELTGSVPTEPHDVAVHGYATEDGWVVR